MPDNPRPTLTILLRQAPVVELTARTKDSAIIELGSALVTGGLISAADTPDIIHGLLRREQRGAPCGGGVAWPHLATRVVEKPVIVLGRSREGIPWDAIDDSPMRVSLLILMPSDQPSLMLRVQMEWVRLASDEHFVEAVLRCELESIPTLVAEWGMFNRPASTNGDMV